MNFDAFPAYGRYRTLRLVSPALVGYDVYALQTALQELGHAIAADGVFGPQTRGALVQAQGMLGVTVDGLAGGATQTAICKHIASSLPLPVGLLFGQLTHESGCRVGNYSPQRADGTYDAGVAQRNTRYTHPSLGFGVPGSIGALAETVFGYHRRYAGVPHPRRWKLAAGAWNAPAFANWIARAEGAFGIRAPETLRPSDAARATLESYMASVTAFAQF